MDLSDVDVDWVKDTLTQFVSKARPVNQSGNGLITTQSGPACGRAEAIRLAEPVRMVLDRLYEGWKEENKPRRNFEFAQERDASQRLLSRIETYEETSKRLGQLDHSPRITAASLHERVWEAARSRWNHGHHADAVNAASIAVNALLQVKVSRTDKSERKLVQESFSTNDPKPGQPRLRFPNYVTEDSRSSMLDGVRSFGEGCFAAIRNMLAHRPDEEIDLTEQEALERLAALSLLARWIDEAELVEAEGDEVID